jgi:hypothetical protein
MEVPMTPITTMDRAAVKRLSDAVVKALTPIAEQHGLEIKVGGGRFDPEAGTFRPKVEFALSDSAQREFANWAELYDMKPDDFGRTFTTRGKTFCISGIAPRSPKRPILADEVDGAGRTFKFEAAPLRRLLDRDAKVTA